VNQPPFPVQVCARAPPSCPNSSALLLPSWSPQTKRLSRLLSNSDSSGQCLRLFPPSCSRRLHLTSTLNPPLGIFVRALDLERGTIYLRQHGELYSWAKPGLSPVRGVNPIDFPYTRTKLKEQGLFAYTSPDELPDEAASERKYFREQGPASLLVLLLASAGKFFGGLAFETITYSRIWPSEGSHRLRLVANLFASALLIKEAQEELAVQLRFERSISDISASFVSHERLPTYEGTKVVGLSLGKPLLVLWSYSIFSWMSSPPRPRRVGGLRSPADRSRAGRSGTRRTSPVVPRAGLANRYAGWQ